MFRDTGQKSGESSGRKRKEEEQNYRWQRALRTGLRIFK